MGFKSLTARTILVFAGLDVMFNPLVIVAFVSLLGVGGARAPVFILAVLVLVKILSCAAYIRHQFRSYEALAVADGSARTKELVLRADEQLQGSVTRIGVFYAFSWSLTYGLAFLILR